MRNLFLMMVLAITTITGNAQTLDSIVDYLEQDNEMAVQISDDPTTGFQRIAVYKRLTHDTRLDVINADVEVHVYYGGEMVHAPSPMYCHWPRSRMSFLKPGTHTEAKQVPASCQNWCCATLLVRTL